MFGISGAIMQGIPRKVGSIVGPRGKCNAMGLCLLISDRECKQLKFYIDLQWYRLY